MSTRLVGSNVVTMEDHLQAINTLMHERHKLDKCNVDLDLLEQVRTEAEAILKENKGPIF